MPTRHAAAVHIGTVDGAPTIYTTELSCAADVPGIDQGKFMDYALRAKTECPVSKALAAVSSVKLSASLVV